MSANQRVKAGSLSTFSAHVAMLRRFGIAYGQGMHFSMAVPSARFAEFAEISASGRWSPPARRKRGKAAGAGTAA